MNDECFRLSGESKGLSLPHPENRVYMYIPGMREFICGSSCIVRQFAMTSACSVSYSVVVTIHTHTNIYQVCDRCHICDEESVRTLGVDVLPPSPPSPGTEKKNQCEDNTHIDLVGGKGEMLRPTWYVSIFTRKKGKKNVCLFFSISRCSQTQ